MQIVKMLFMSLWCVLLFNVSSICYAEALMKDDIIRRHEQGASSTQLIDAIQEQGLGFEVSLVVLEEFIKKGISQDVLEALLSSGKSHSETSRPTRNFIRASQAGVTVLTNPPGLTLTIDGKSQGVTPFLSNKLKKGSHLFKVSHPLYFTKQEEVVFDGKTPIELAWDLEPREPVIRLNVKIDKGTSHQPWSWIVRPRNQCQGCSVNLKLKAWQSVSTTGEAIFLLTEESKRTFRGEGVGCLELNIWEGEVRRDLPIRKLPPPAAKYFISDIKVDGIETVDLSIEIEIKELNRESMAVTLMGDSGFIIKAELDSAAQQEKKKYSDMIETLDGIIQ